MVSQKAVAGSMRSTRSGSASSSSHTPPSTSIAVRPVPSCVFMMPAVMSAYTKAMLASLSHCMGPNVLARSLAGGRGLRRFDACLSASDMSSTPDGCFASASPFCTTTSSRDWEIASWYASSRSACFAASAPPGSASSRDSQIAPCRATSSSSAAQPVCPAGRRGLVSAPAGWEVNVRSCPAEFSAGAARGSPEHPFEEGCAPGPCCTPPEDRLGCMADACSWAPLGDRCGDVGKALPLGDLCGDDGTTAVFSAG
mmetsp:Transcript_93037/g.263285  ORF Transcript_93037/g.263285 Transcript_93037/m.263285 type:complete len:255 (+) Transcript_93037:303-1067(+)